MDGVSFIRLPDGAYKPSPDSYTRVVLQGNVIELRIYEKRIFGRRSSKDDRDLPDLRTPEEIEDFIDSLDDSERGFYHSVLDEELPAEWIKESVDQLEKNKNVEKRFGDNKQSFFRSLRHAREIINSTFTSCRNTVFLTLTYAQHGNGPMTDREKAYTDFKDFWKKFKGFNKNKLNRGEVCYFSACEPQGSGSWHYHVLIGWLDGGPVPFMDYDYLRKLWKHGAIYVEKIKDYNNGQGVDNLGAYLTSYLTDIVENGQKKKYARLKYYKAYMKPFNHSRNCKYPVYHDMMYDEALKYVQGLSLDYSSDCSMLDSSGECINTISKRFYNRLHVVA